VLRGGRLVEELLKLLGLGTPFIYAAATYGLFHYLDERASGEAKEAISKWIRSTDYNREDISTTMVEVFDRFYTRPLFGWTAFLRSMLISIAVLGIFYYEYAIHTEFRYPLELNKVTIPLLLSNIVSDYISIFAIRRALHYAGQRPVVSLLIAELVGSIIVFVLLMLRDIVTVYLMIGISALSAFIDHPYRAYLAYTSLQYGLNLSFTAPTLAVHLWLALFAFGLAFMRLLHYAARVAVKVQWFLDKGETHPLDAVGYVAAVTLPP